VVVRALLFVAAGGFALFVVASLLYLQTKNAHQAYLISAAQLHVEVQQKALVYELRNVAQDLLFLADQDGIHDVVSNLSGLPQITRDFHSMMNSTRCRAIALKS